MGRRILAIDDDVLWLELISRTLQAAGYEVVTANDGQGGVRLARELIPELILCDLRMPWPNGYQIAVDIKRDPRTRSIKVVAMTGSGMMTTCAEARATAFDDLILKQWDHDEIVKRVRRIIGDA